MNTSKWQPFDTAPEDGSEIQAWSESWGVFSAQWVGDPEDGDMELGNWFSVGGEDLTGDLPTLWQPMAAGPDEAERKWRTDHGAHH